MPDHGCFAGVVPRRGGPDGTHISEAETQVRQGVLFRKISGGRRSWMGAWVLERL